jgi:hypothetical protein
MTYSHESLTLDSLDSSEARLELEGKVKIVTEAYFDTLLALIDDSLDGPIDVVSNQRLQTIARQLPEDIKNACLDFALRKVKAFESKQGSLIEQENFLMLATLFGKVPQEVVDNFLIFRLRSLVDDDDGVEAMGVLNDLKIAGLIDEVTYQQHVTRIEGEDIVEVASTDTGGEA